VTVQATLWGMDGDDEALLRMFIRTWKRDTDDGVTLRSVHNRVTGLSERTSQQLHEQDRRIMKLETTKQVEDDFELKTNPGLRTPQAFPAPGVNVNIGSNTASNGGRVTTATPLPAKPAPASVSPWLRVFQPTIGKAILVLVAAALSALTTHLAHQPQIVYVPVPAGSAAATPR